jgi:hypothetical protein
MAPGGDAALIVDESGGLSLWKLPGERVFRVAGPFAEAEFLAQGRIAALGRDDVLHVIDAERGLELAAIEVGHAQAHLAWSGSGGVLLFADAGAAAVELGPASFVSQEKAAPVPEPRPPVDAGGEIASIATGAGLTVAGLREGKLKVWDAAGKLVLERTTSGAPSPVAVGARHALSVIAGVPELVPLDGGPARPLAASEIYAAAFSPDGRFLATGGGPRTARVFAADTGLLVADLDGLAAPVVALAWDPRPEVERLVTTGADGQVSVWETRSGRLLARFEVFGVALAPRFDETGTRLTLEVEGQRLTYRLDEEKRAPIDVSSRVGARSRYKIERGRLLPR